MERIPVTSSNIDEIGFTSFADGTGTLEVRFVASGDVYQYFEVPGAHYHELMRRQHTQENPVLTRESVGSYFAREIRGGGYSYEKIRHPTCRHGIDGDCGICAGRDPEPIADPEVSLAYLPTGGPVLGGRAVTPAPPAPEEGRSGVVSPPARPSITAAAAAAVLQASVGAAESTNALDALDGAIAACEAQLTLLRRAHHLMGGSPVERRS